LITQYVPDYRGGLVDKHIWTDKSPRPTTPTKRNGERRDIAVPARLTWKDQRGVQRFASVVTRNVSEFGVYVECQSAVSIPMFRLVQLQLERTVRDDDKLPSALRFGRVLSAVYRVSPGTTSGRPQCLALRLMVDPRRQMTDVVTDAEPDRATA
jgi:hypothetical protein